MQGLGYVWVTLVVPGSPSQALVMGTLDDHRNGGVQISQYGNPFCQTRLHTQGFKTPNVANKRVFKTARLKCTYPGLPEPCTIDRELL